MDPHISGASPVHPNSLRMLMKAAAAEEIRQSESETDFEQWCELDAFNPMAMMRRFKPLHEFKFKEKTEEAKTEESQKILEVEKIEEAAARFQKKNDELQAAMLLLLRSRISASDRPDDVIRKVQERYADPALADEALDFLLETADPNTTASIKNAKEQFNAQFAREIAAGRNMGVQAREFSRTGLGSPTSLRDLYRDITANPREPIELFDELSDQYPYDKLKTIIRFLLHSLGADLRAKGPSISRAELIRLIDETRSLQGILGIYRFFLSRMGLIGRQFDSYQVEMPGNIHFTLLAKLLIKLLKERFMTPEKILQTAKALGISEETIAQIILFTHMKDAVGQITPRYYRSPQQRQELLKAFLTALEELEDRLEEDDEEKEDQKE